MVALTEGSKKEINRSVDYRSDRPSQIIRSPFILRLNVIPLYSPISSIDKHNRLWQLLEALLISKLDPQPVAIGDKAEP